MLNYFDPKHKIGSLEQQKAFALKWIMVSLFVLLLLLIIQSLVAETFTSISDYFLPVGMGFVIVVLVILRNHGLKRAGNFFSIGAIVIMTIVINVFDQDTIFTKYTEELYLAIFVLVFISLFSTRKILLIGASIFFVSSIRTSIYLQNTFPEQVDLLKEVQIFFSFTIINISLILYFATRFSEMAISNAKRDYIIKEQQNKTLTKAVKELDRFVYSASHDLGAPLKSISGLVNIARLENKDVNIDLHLDYIEQSIAKQERVIGSLIEYSKNSRIEITKTAIELHGLTAEIVEGLKYMPGFDKVKVINDLSEGQVISSDEMRLKIILNNLISNSIKYRNEMLDNCYVRISTKEMENFWLLIIEDNGQGIAEKHQNNIFSMFYRANSKAEGSGLGLYIVHEAIDLLGGDISLDSVEYEGTTFNLKLPKQ